jgi:hypothetical protein
MIIFGVIIFGAASLAGEPPPETNNSMLRRSNQGL